MRILTLTIGSRGDVQPYVALGAGLRAAGHEVMIATCDRFRDGIEAHGLEFAPMDDALLQLLDRREGRAMLEELTGPISALRIMRRLWGWSRDVSRRLLEDGWRAVQEFRPDLILHHPKIVGAAHHAERAGVPVITAALVPMVSATGRFPCPGFPTLPLGAPYNRATHRLVHRLTWRMTRGPVNAWRASQGMRPAGRGVGVTVTATGAPIPVVHGFSEHVLPAPRDWPDTACATGYWVLPAPVSWAPDPALAAFLADGPPPVYVGFGSMAGSDPARTTETVLDAVQRAGVRCLLAAGWGGLVAERLPASVHLIDEAPHDRLFPLVSVVVHHGGAGTTAAGLRAGRPTVVCPFALDQPFWGAIVHRLGAGPAPIPQRRLTATALASAITAATTTPSFATVASRLGAALQAEDGVAAAVRRIHELVGDGIDRGAAAS